MSEVRAAMLRSLCCVEIGVYKAEQCVSEVAVNLGTVYDNVFLARDAQLYKSRFKGIRMTRRLKKGRSMKMARLNARRKLKARIKRQNVAKYAARTGKELPSGS